MPTSSPRLATKRPSAITDAEADRTATCLDCGLPFVVTAAEQVWYRDHARLEPERCPLCRERRRAERNAPLLAAHQAEESSAAERGVTVYGGPGHRHTAGPPPRHLYPAICHSCGKETEVPFIPRGNRPVYCRDCFSQRRGRR
jgi:CxxC-x17-CxxC domain-containing protein